MGKKIAIGCLVLFLVGLVVGGFLAYRYLYQPAKEYVAGLGEFSEVAQMDGQIQNTDAYQPPDDRLISQDQLDKFLSVQRHMQSVLGGRQAELQQKYEALSGAGEGNVGLGDVVGALQDLGGLMKEAKAAQVEAINREGLSLEEYEWVKQEVYNALGQSVVGLNLENLSEAIGSQDPSVLTEQSETSDAPEANQQLVAPYREELLKGLLFAGFGL